MEIKQGYSYHIKEIFFTEMQNSSFMSNKENGHYRPHYYAIEDQNNCGIFWMIPISSKAKNINRLLMQK